MTSARAGPIIELKSNIISLAVQCNVRSPKVDVETANHDRGLDDFKFAAYIRNFPPFSCQTHYHTCTWILLYKEVNASANDIWLV